MKMIKTALMTMLLFAGSAQAGEWNFGVGVSYVTGISDVADIYEDNLELETSGEVDVILIPVGVGFVGRYQSESGLMAHVGIGPAFIIAGDADHIEIPFSATVGYAFSPKGDSSAYARIGVAAHSVSGDYVEDSEPGMLAAIGVENGRNSGVNWGLEVSVDDSEVELENLSTGRNETVNSYDTQLTLYFLF